MKRNLYPWSAAVLMLLAAHHSAGTTMPEDVALHFDEGITAQWVALDDAELDALRGGFDLGNGLRVSFGVMRSIAINGEQVSRTSFYIPDLKTVTSEQARNAGQAMQQLVQIGHNNTVTPSAWVPSELTGATIVQNSLNNQRISTLTEINTAVNSMGLIKTLNARSTLEEALLGSVGIR